MSLDCLQSGCARPYGGLHHASAFCRRCTDAGHQRQHAPSPGEGLPTTHLMPRKQAQCFKLPPAITACTCLTSWPNAQLLLQHFRTTSGTPPLIILGNYAGSLQACQFGHAAAAECILGAAERLARQAELMNAADEEGFTALHCACRWGHAQVGAELAEHACMHSFVPSFLHSFLHSFIHSFLPSFLPSFLHSFLHSFIHSFTARLPICRSGALQQMLYGSPPACPVLRTPPPRK